MNDSMIDHSESSNKLLDAKLIREKQHSHQVRDGADVEINAYFLGFEKGISFLEDAQTQLFLMNNNKIAKAILSVVDFIKINSKFTVEKLYVKILGYNNYEFLILIPESMFFSDKFKGVFVKLYEVSENLLENEKIRFDVAIVPTEIEIDEEVLKSDGFKFTINIGK